MQEPCCAMPGSPPQRIFSYSCIPLEPLSQCYLLAARHRCRSILTELLAFPTTDAIYYQHYNFPIFQKSDFNNQNNNVSFQSSDLKPVMANHEGKLHKGDAGTRVVEISNKSNICVRSLLRPSGDKFGSSETMQSGQALTKENAVPQK